jgi:F0F1-type ATP synthase assembly protein I
VVGPGDDTGKRGPESPFKAVRSVGPLLSAGIQLAVTVVAMFFIGRWLDGKFDTSPWLMIVGGLIGSAGGLISFIRTAMAVGRAESKKEPSSDNKE